VFVERVTNTKKKAVDTPAAVIQKNRFGILILI